MRLRRRVRALEQRRKLRRRRDAVDDQLVVPQPADHVEVEHRVDAVDRHRAVLDEVRRAEQTFFLAGEVREDDRASRRRRGEQPRELEDRGGARRVVVGAAAHGVARLGIERALGGRAEVIEVRADHDVLTAQRRVAARQHGEDVLRRQRRALAACAGGRAAKCCRYIGAAALQAERLRSAARDTPRPSRCPACR